MKPVPVTIYDGTNTTTVNRINAPAGSVDPNGVLDLGQGIKVYTALLTQTGTDAPVATVLENTLGGEVVWTRDDIGLYTGTLAGAFPSATATALPPIGVNQSVTEQTTFVLALFERADEDRLKIGTYTVDPSSGTQTEGDALLTNAYVEILVYP